MWLFVSLKSIIFVHGSYRHPLNLIPPFTQFPMLCLSSPMIHLGLPTMRIVEQSMGRSLRILIKVLSKKTLRLGVD